MSFKTGEQNNSLNDYKSTLFRYLTSKEERTRISISTAHKFKGMEDDNIVILDANDGRFPLLHAKWIFGRIFGDTIESIEEEEKRLFYVALSRAVKNLYVFVDGSDHQFLDECMRESPFITTEINLDDYPMSKEMFNQVRVSIKGDHVFDIKGMLKYSKYSWSNTEKSWSRIYPASFTTEKFIQEWWVSKLTNNNQFYTVEVDNLEKKETYELRYCKQKNSFSLFKM